MKRTRRFICPFSTIYFPPRSNIACNISRIQIIPCRLKRASKIFFSSLLEGKEKLKKKKKTHARRILMGNLSNNKFKTTQFRGSSSISAIGWKKEKKKEKLVRFVFKYKDHTPFFLNASGEHSRSEIIRLS